MSQQQQSQQLPSYAPSEAKHAALLKGCAAMAAGLVQVMLFMPLRTAMLVSHGNNKPRGLKALPQLYRAGGLRRLYAGVGVAMFAAPAGRFLDAGAHSFAHHVLDGRDKQLPSGVKSAAGAVIVAGVRLLAMPIDNVKVICQVNGLSKVADGVAHMRRLVAAEGPLAMYRGATVTAVAAGLGNVCWFGPFKILNDRVPHFDEPAAGGQRLAALKKHARSGAIGGFCSLFSDLCTNSFRVLKTNRQTAATRTSYLALAKSAYAQDGILFGLRGIRTKLLTNCLQGALFGVLWRSFTQRLEMRVYGGQRTR